MNAIDFVKKHGWDAVIEAVKTTPLDHDFQSTDLEPKLAKDGSIIGFDCKVHTISHAAVKRLVESHELLGIIDFESPLLDELVDELIETGRPRLVELGKRIKQAIADVEACQGVAQ